MEPGLFYFICFKCFSLGFTAAEDDNFLDFFKDIVNIKEYLKDLIKEWYEKTPEQKEIWKNFCK